MQRGLTPPPPHRECSVVVSGRAGLSWTVLGGVCVGSTLLCNGQRRWFRLPCLLCPHLNVCQKERACVCVCTRVVIPK